MNEEFLRQLLAELIEAQKQALSCLTSALASQGDADMLFRALQSARAHLAKTAPLAMDGSLIDHMLAAAKDQADVQARAAMRQRDDEEMQ